MSYQVRFTDTTKTPITVEDQTINNEKSVTFVGKNFAGYSQYIAENFLHLLENFAKNSAPTAPVAGQLWYDTTTGVENQLKLWTGTNWVPASNIKKSPSQPSSSVIGDLWVDTDNQQLYLYNGSAWILVGPQYSVGQKTGAEIETIVDTSDNTRSVLSFFVMNNRVAIFSDREFFPKASLSGFTKINQGLNLSSNNFNSSTDGTKFWGVAEKANALIVGSAVVAATNFLRKDEPSTTNYSLSVRNNAGISIGGDLALSIAIDNNSAVIYNKISGSSIDFKVKTGTTTPTVLRIDSSERVGINKTNPDEALDVSGNIKTNSKLIVTGTTDSTNLTTGSIVTSGGASVAKLLRVGAGVNVTGDTTLESLLPKSDSSYNIGSNATRFDKIYANVVGTPTADLGGRQPTSFYGTFNGTLTGSLSGSASKLLNTTSFSLGDKIDSNGNIVQVSDIVSYEAIPFDGSGNPNAVVLTGIISSSFIANKIEATDSFLTDEFLINRGGLLRRVSKQQIISNIATVPPGTILPFAGSNIPLGYLLCDGSEQLVASYPELFAVIQYAYKSFSLVTPGYFGLPDFRGRFPLGRDDMNNISGVPNPANRVTDVAADSLGGVGGTSEVTVSRNNLPEHVHNMKGDAGSQFYAIASRTGAPPDTNAQSANGLTAVGQGQLMVDSGGVYMDDLPSNTLGVPLSVTNHYQTVNYIIFTGRIQ